jgi:PAS domain S-box-containing protein
VSDNERAVDCAALSEDTRKAITPLPEQLPVPYTVLSADGTILQVNGAWLDALGRDRSTVEGRPFTDVLHPESRSHFETQFATLRNRGGVSAVELDAITADDRTLRVSLSAQAEFDDSGELERVHCQFHEVAGSKDRQSQLQAQNAKIEALHDVAMAVEEAHDEAAVYRTLVEAAEEVLDFDIAIADAAVDGELVPKAVSEGVASESYERVPIEGSSTLGARAFRSGETDLVLDQGAADDSGDDHEFASVLSVPIGDQGVFQAVDREPGAFDELDRDLAELLVAHGQDALDRIETLETLRERTASLGRERNRLAAIFEAVPEPIAHVRYEDGVPVVVAVNSAFEATFGQEGAAIEGESINDLIVPEEGRGTARELDRAAESAGMVEREVRRITPEGERTFRLRSAALETAGEPEALAIYVDLSEEKRRERELERENERLEQFASIVSHDLRSPLSVAKGRLDLVGGECESPHIEEVSRAIDRMDAIIGDVLTLTREGRSVERGEIEPVAVSDLASEAWAAVDAEGASLVVESERIVEADRSRLRRVFENLFWNAIEHAGPSVTVTVDDTPDGLFVADDGPGIPEEDRDRVFESGYTTSRNGTGLGLKIVREIIEAHGWSIELSESAAGGARFEIHTG